MFEEDDTPEGRKARVGRLQREFLAAGTMPTDDVRSKEIEYIDIAPPPFEPTIPLVELFERLTRLKADGWQHDFCHRLEQSCADRSTARTWSVVHAEGQLGKSKILAQVFPAWILGHDPMHRVALATYNITRSQSHSKAVIELMNLPVYKEIFRDSAGWVKRGTAVSGWQTEARLSSTESQFSYNPVGLQSGLTGSGFDTLIVDDPYADQREAFSDTVRKNLQEFWDFTVGSRIGLFTNVFAMFHRYHVQDLAGYLLDTGDFDYWRYASIADGDYIHEETGMRFKDPLGREIGELVSPERRPHQYYAKPRTNPRVWNSMFQGKPTSDEGEFFNVSRIKIISPEEGEIRRQESIVLARAWDNAATAEGGDLTAGLLGGIRSDGGVTVFDAILEQVDSGARLGLQRSTAMIDGRDVAVCIPQDPGSSGKDMVFVTKQSLEGFSVHARPTMGSKEMRALPFSTAVNSGLVEFVEGPWNKRVLTALRDFPLSDVDDPVDAGADMYTYLYEIARKGLVVKGLEPQRHMITWDSFSSQFTPKGAEVPIDQIPANWTLYVGVQITAEASRPNSAVIVARAPRNTLLSDTLFVVAEYKEYTSDMYALFDWVTSALDSYCADGKGATIWLHPESATHAITIRHKIGLPVRLFEGDASAGITELDWYLRSGSAPSPFNPIESASSLYALVSDPTQLSAAHNEYGLYALRQEARTWAFNDRHEPNEIGAVLNCLRMVTFAFRTYPTDFTREEKIERALDSTLQLETIRAMPQSAEKDGTIQRRLIETKRVTAAIDAPVRGPWAKGRR